MLRSALVRRAPMPVRRYASASTPATTGRTVPESVFKFDPANKASWPKMEEAMLPEEVQAMHHAEKAMPFWWRINVFFAIPALIAVACYGVPVELEHLKHLKEHPHEFVAMSHLNKRTKPFPWGDGDKSLFHNDLANPRPPQ